MWSGLSCFPSNEPELDIAREAHVSFGYLNRSIFEALLAELVFTFTLSYVVLCVAVSDVTKAS